MSVFYVLHILDEQISHCIEAVRLICEPNIKHRAHLTVRGPYKQKIAITSINKRLVDQFLTIYGTGNFFSFGQQTVFFRCSSPDLRAVWHKPHYPFNPHITLYDGGSLEFAKELYNVVSKYEYNLRVHATDLEALLSVRGQRTLDIPIGFNLQNIEDIIDDRFNLAELRDWSADRRLMAVDRLLGVLQAQSLPRSPSLKAVKSELSQILDVSNNPGRVLTNLYRILSRTGKQDRIFDPDTMIPLLLITCRPLLVPAGTKQISDLYVQLSEAEKEELRVLYLERSRLLEQALSLELSEVKASTDTLH